MGELHLEVYLERMRREYSAAVETGQPQVAYRETITRKAEFNYTHKKQTGGAGQFAEVHIRMYPFPEGTNPEEYATKERFPQLKDIHHHEKHNFLWIDSIVSASIPGNFMPAVEKGFLERLNQGVIAGYAVQNLCVEVHFGKDHPVDSNETAFRIADRALDVSGGYGMFKKSELERLFRDARAGRFHPANAALTHKLIAKMRLGIDLDEQPRWG